MADTTGLLELSGEIMGSLERVCRVVELHPEQASRLEDILFSPASPRFGSMRRPRPLLLEARVDTVRRLVNAVAHSLVADSPRAAALLPGSAEARVLVTVVLARPQVTPGALTDLARLLQDIMDGDDSGAKERAFVLCHCIREIVHRQVHPAHRAELVSLLDREYVPGRFLPMDAMMAAAGVSLTPRTMMM